MGNYGTIFMYSKEKLKEEVFPLRVSYERMHAEFVRVLEKYGFDPQRAQLCATLFAQTSLDGVYTHGLNRFPRFISNIQSGIVHVDARPECVGKIGVIERWDGHQGVGNLTAYTCMARAIELAHENTIGVVALKNNNHWMRPGAYGLMAAQQDCIGILWTNTTPNMPPWGGKEAKLGNNPVVIAMPNGDSPLLLDVAMSLFSYGKMEMSVLQGKQLPFEGGFDEEGNLTRDPAKILKSAQPLPIGYWKGSGLSLLLDLLAASLAGGCTTYEIGQKPQGETDLSQIFVAIDLKHFPDRAQIQARIEATLADLAATTPVHAGDLVRYPGAGMQKVRKDNLENGIPVDESVWNTVCAF
jgi:3-dehydro-L-gulonate 2-dehydrogenase